MQTTIPSPSTRPVLGGPTATTPPPSVPLAFLAAAGVGLVGFGTAVALGADRAVEDPRLPSVIGVVHLGVLAALTVAVLGALHQFGPVVGRRPLRSVVVARVTFGAIVAAAWLIPTGFVHGPDDLIPVGGVLGAVAVVLAAWNLSAPLSARDGGVPVAGLRCSVAYLLVTVGFGVVYAFDRQANWFPLLSHRVLAHAHLGLVGWLGLTYVSVAEKLWPMFLLSHRERARSGGIAVALIAAGILPLALGLLFGVPVLGWVGAVAVAGGFAAHLTSLAAAVRHRRRPLELLHAFLFTSAAFLVAAVVLGLVAAVADVDPADRARLVAAEVAAGMAWLMLAVIGQAHKIVPFIAYSSLRARGIRKAPDGKPLLFGHLFNHPAARATFVLATVGFTATVVGLLASSPATIVVGGIAIAATGVVASANLASGPRRVARAQEPA